MSEEVIEAEVVESVELEPVLPSNLFRTDDPAEVLRRAMSTADALMPVVREKGLIARIGNKEHLTVEAWQTLGAMLGVTAVCTWTHKLDNGWEARVEARTLDGRVVGAAEAECLKAEGRWGDADDFAVRSMAQTRATSKALASVLRFVATLGGAAGTPAEEMPRDGGTRKLEGPATPPQKRAITTLLNKAGVDKDLQRAIVHALAGDPPTKQGASQILDVLNDESIRYPEQRVEVLMQRAKVERPTDLPDPDTTDLPDPDERDDDGTTIP